MDYSKESIDRQQKIASMKDAGIICYANNFRGKQDIDEIRKASENEYKEVDVLMENGSTKKFRTAGRIISSRGMGKLTFAKLRDNTGDIQVCFMRDKVDFNTGRQDIGQAQGIAPTECRDAPCGYPNKIVSELEIAGEMKSAYKIAEKFCQVGDYIGIEGDLFLTKHGELTIFVKEFQVLSKAVRPLPEKFHGVQDKETIYRQRYLDLIMNQESFDRFQFRSNFTKAIREFYWKQNFMEIETPVLGNSASGAAAQPFITHHNDFDEDYFLRIAPETALKKATVGRFERVFEIGKNYRNEGSDPSHMQEFTAVEHYATYWNFEDNMKFTEEMFDYIFETMKLDREVKIKDKEGIEKIVSFNTPFQRIDYIAGVKEKSGIDISEYVAGDEEKLRKAIVDAGYKWEGMDKQATATMIDYLYKKVLRPSIIGPAFVYNYPKTMQPLARASDENENIVEQFQLVLNGWEVLKAYSELVDPKIQQEKFDEQSGAIEMGDEEATTGDDDFVLAMEYGMPCQSGWGMGIDRIVSLLTEQENLRDVVLFPLMKSEKDEKNSKNTNLAVCILNKSINMEKWQELNTIAHLNASYGARNGKGLFDLNEVSTKDGEKVSMNTSHAIMIKQTNNSSDIFSLIENAKKNNLHISEFTREMLETSDDKKVSENTKNKDYKDIEYMGVLVYGNKKEVEKLTGGFGLYGGDGFQKEENKELNYDNLELPSIEEALFLVEKYATNTKNHLISVGYAMKYFANKLGENEQIWQLVGLLHDIDWDYIEKDGEKHCKQDLEKIVSEINLPKELIDDIKSHASWITGIKSDTKIRKYLCSVDELTGFITAVGKMMPNKKIEEVKVRSILKKIKDKKFAAGVSREQIKNCEIMLNIELEDFIEDLLVGLKKYASNFGM